MPTENRSSNTDPRDVFIRLNPLGLGEAELRKDSTGFEDQRTHSDYLLFLAGYRETHPEPQPHPEPIAWMVGTAFWWTKEEAERDAAATGLPIVGLGPMAGAAPAEQYQGEPVVSQCALCCQTHEQVSVGRVGGQQANGCDVDFTTWRCEGCGGSWTGDPDDPGEVERLRNELGEAKGEYDRSVNKVADLRAQLAEAHALLREIHDGTLSGYQRWSKIEDLLNASAEPSEPIAWHVGGNGYDRICFEKPDYLPGHPCIQAIHDQHQLIELLKRYDLRDEDAPPDERAHGIPGTSFQRLNALANQGE